jgi:hypothetical protein
MAQFCAFNSDINQNFQTKIFKPKAEQTSWSLQRLSKSFTPTSKTASETCKNVAHQKKM